MTARWAAVGARGPLLIAVAVVLTFANAVHDGFHFDDAHSLVENPHIRQLASAGDFFVDPQLFSRNVGSEMYRPLVLTSYALTYRLFGYRAPAYHFFNIAVHLLVALAVHALYRRLGLRDGPALAAALLFAVHPLVCEPVNYVSSRSESLAALFFGVGLWAYADERRWAWALVCYGAALASKSSAVVLPAALLGYEVLMRAPETRPRWQRLWPFAALAAAYLVASSRLLREAVVEAPVRSWSEQLWTQAKALVYYGKLLVVPRPLSVEHQFAVSSDWAEPVVVAVLALAVGWAYLLWRARRWRPLLFWLAWGGLALLPTLIVPLNMLVNERRLYLPLVAALGALAWVVDRSQRQGSGHWAAGALVLLLAALAVERNEIWTSEKALWTAAREQAPQMVRPHVRLGAIYRAEGDLAVARAAYAAALAIDPDHAPTHNNLGNLHRDAGDFAAAEGAYRRALALLPGYVDALINLATLLGDQGRFEQALPLFEGALQNGGQRVEVYNNLGTAHLKMGAYARAEAILRRGIALGAPRPGLYFNLGGALEGQGQMAAATAAYGRAVEIDSTYARAYYNLALLYEGEGDAAAAADNYQAFLRHWRGAAAFSAQAQERLQRLARDRR
ncbi:MAG: tetratricopeptide repeat protein [Candidatus Latescibacteria bacterium]|nr:tetratricopeptide repeat protein [Candidatus Latescibacterota bacterium]